MTKRERRSWTALTAARALLSLLDLVGVLAIGFLVTSTAVFLTEGSDPNRVLEFAGLSIPAVNASTLPWVAGAVIGLFLAKALMSIVLNKKAAYFVAGIEARAARTITEIGLGGDLVNAASRSREEMMYAVQFGSPAAFTILLNSANTFFTESMLFLVICLGFLFVDPVVTLAAIVYFGIVAFVVQFFIGSMMSRAGSVSAVAAVDGNRALTDLQNVFRELLVLRKRGRYINSVYEARLRAAESSAATHFLGGMPRYIIEAALLVGVALFILSQSVSGEIVGPSATIGVFLSGGFRLTAALLPLQAALLTMKSIIPSAMTAHEILSSEPLREASVDSSETLSEVEIGSQEPIGVTLRNVEFAYPNSKQPAVRNVSFEIEPGTQTALMGPSGAGKSTIADLICRVLTPTHGSLIRTDDNSLSDNASSRNVSYVPQKPGLVSGSIADNVALGEEPQSINRSRVLESLRLAQLADLVQNLPQGLDTNLGKLQDGLSGGQIQRLGLARALYTNPGLLVMDEATSALDAESEAEIQKALEAMRGKVTVLLIAHRLNTIQHADKVILVEDGQVRDSGTFKELMARNPSVERVVELMKVEKD